MTYIVCVFVCVWLDKWSWFLSFLMRQQSHCLFLALIHSSSSSYFWRFSSLSGSYMLAPPYAVLQRGCTQMQPRLSYIQTGSSWTSVGLILICKQPRSFSPAKRDWSRRLSCPQRWEGCRSQKKDEKGEGTTVEFRGRSMGRFWQHDDGVAR